MTAPQGLIFDPTTGQYYMPTPQQQPMGAQPMPVTAPGYAPQQQFMPPMAYAQPAPAPAAVSADRSFKGLYSQQTGGGPFWKFKDRPIGTAYEGIVSRPLTEADVDVQQFEGRIQTQRDGSAKVQLNVPMLVMPSQDFPDGIGRLGLRSDMLGKLPAAMAAVGAPKDPTSDSYVPEAGAYIRVELTNYQRVPGVAQPRQVYRIDYRRPDDPHTVAVRQQIEAAHAALVANPQVGQQPGNPAYQQGQWVPQPGPQGYPQPGPYNPQQGYQQAHMQQGAPNGYAAPTTPPAPPTAPPAATNPPAAAAAAPGQQAPEGMPVGQIDPAAWAALSDDQKQAWLKVTGQQPPATQ